MRKHVVSRKDGFSFEKTRRDKRDQVEREGVGERRGERRKKRSKGKKKGEKDTRRKRRERRDQDLKREEKSG